MKTDLFGKLDHCLIPNSWKGQIAAWGQERWHLNVSDSILLLFSLICWSWVGEPSPKQLFPVIVGADHL